MLHHFGKQPSIPQNLNKEARRSSSGELLKEDEDVSTQKLLHGNSWKTYMKYSKEMFNSSNVHQIANEKQK